MRKSLLVAGTAAVTVVLAGCEFEEMGRARYSEDFHYAYDLKPDGRLSLETFNGSVEIYGWDQDRAEINGTKYASTQDMLDSIRIEVTPRSDSIDVRTIAPREYRNGNRGAKFVVHVPRRTRIDRVDSSNGGIRVEDLNGDARLRTSNGGVRLVRFDGDVDTRTSNGPITLEDFSGGAVLATSNGGITAHGVRGYLDAQTSNGPIDTTVEELETSRPLKLHTSNGPVRLTLPSGRLTDITAISSNGSITLRLPGNANARLKARTSNSSVNSEFTLAETVVEGKSRLEGVIGSGGPVLDLSTSNGRIRLERSAGMQAEAN